MSVDSGWVEFDVLLIISRSGVRQMQLRLVGDYGFEVVVDLD